MALLRESRKSAVYKIFKNCETLAKVPCVGEAHLQKRSYTGSQKYHVLVTLIYKRDLIKSRKSACIFRDLIHCCVPSLGVRRVPMYIHVRMRIYMYIWRSLQSKFKFKSVHGHISHLHHHTRQNPHTWFFLANYLCKFLTKWKKSWTPALLALWKSGLTSCTIFIMFYFSHDTLFFYSEISEMNRGRQP